MGFKSKNIEVTKANAANLLIILEYDAVGALLDELVVTSEKIDSTALFNPLTVQSLSFAELQAAPSFDIYDAVANLREVDFATQSLIFKSVNTRGFNSTSNSRFLQVIDGIDNQAPGFNFSFGNLAGLNELDISDITLQPGAASSRYGPSAFNGVLVIDSKDPFEFEGASAYYKFGGNNFTERGIGNTVFDFGGGQIHDVGVRVAKRIGKRMAVKATTSYLKVW